MLVGRVVAGSRGGNRGRSAVLSDGATGAPNNESIDVGGVRFEFDAQRRSAVSEPMAPRRRASPQSSVRRPMGIGRSSSIGVGPPGVGRSPKGIPLDMEERPEGIFLLEDLVYRCDDVFIRCYSYPGNGRQLLPIGTPMYNKCVGRMPAVGLHSVRGPVRLRNVWAGRPAIANRLHIGEVVRFEGRTIIRNLEGRRTNTWGSTVHVTDVHHVGKQYHAPGCMHSPPLPRHVRIA